jgi:hypothetical protein
MNCIVHKLEGDLLLHQGQPDKAKLKWADALQGSNGRIPYVDAYCLIGLGDSLNVEKGRQIFDSLNVKWRRGFLSSKISGNTSSLNAIKSTNMSPQ